MDDVRPPILFDSPRFLDRLRLDLRAKGYAYQTEKTYLLWVRRYNVFHGKRRPEQLGSEEISRFLSHLAHQRSCSPATQRIALNALIYLYRKFLAVELEPLSFEHARPARRLPVVLTHDEVARILDQLRGKHKLMVELLYGSGLRFNELLSLRVKDTADPLGSEAAAQLPQLLVENVVVLTVVHRQVDHVHARFLLAGLQQGQ